MPFHTASVMERMSSWFSVHHVTTVPKILMMKFEISPTTVLMTDEIASHTAVTALRNPSFVSHKYFKMTMTAATAAAIAAAVPMIGKAAVTIAPIETPRAVAAACKVRNIGAKIPTTVTTVPRITTNSLIGLGNPLNHSATCLTIFPSISNTGASTSAIAAPTSDMAKVTEF